MYSLPLSSRSRTLSTLVQAPNDSASFDPLSASKRQLSQRPSRQAFVQGTTHELVLDHGDASRRPEPGAPVDDEPDPFQSFVGSALRGQQQQLHDNDRPTTTFSPSCSTSSSSDSPDTPSSRFDNPWYRSFSPDGRTNDTPLSTPASSCCPTRSNSDEALACSSSPVDSAALRLNLAQLDLDSRIAQAKALPPLPSSDTSFPSPPGLASYASPPAAAASNIASSARTYPFPNQYWSSPSVQSQPSASQLPTTSNPFAHPLPDLQRIRSVSLPHRSASEPDIHQSPARLVLGLNASNRRVSEASFASPSSSSDSASDRGTLSPTTPAFSPSSASFLEKPAPASLSTSPNRRRLALPKVDSSNLAAPGAPVLRPTNFWRHTSRSALNSPLAAPSANVHRRSSLINTGAAGSDECLTPDDLTAGCEGKVYGDRIRVQELLM